MEWRWACCRPWWRVPATKCLSSAPTEPTITLAASRLVLPVNDCTEIIATIIEQSGIPVHNRPAVIFTTTLGTIEPREARTNSDKAQYSCTPAASPERPRSARFRETRGQRRSKSRSAARRLKQSS